MMSFAFAFSHESSWIVKIRGVVILVVHLGSFYINKVVLGMFPLGYSERWLV